jgi:RecG-like helicase
MESLTQKLCSISSYEEMEKMLSSKEIIKCAENILDNLKLSHRTNIKDFLCIFPIYKFPKSVLGDIDVGANSDILDYVNTIMKIPNNNDEQLKTAIINFIYNFKKWKTEDKSILIYHLFEEYHQISVDILNTNDNEKQLILKKCQKELLETAFMIGGNDLVNEIKGYRAIITSNINFQREYDKAYWANLKDSYDNHDYEKCLEIIVFIKNVLTSIGNNTQLIEDSTSKLVSYIENKNSNFINIKEWAIQIFDYIKTIHSPVHDMQLESFKRDLHIKEIYLPTVIKNIFCMVKNIIHDFEEIKRKMSQS